MICAIEGLVAELEEQAVLLKTAGGVGYRLFCTTNALAELADKLGQPAELRVEMQTREDGIKLYGFLELEEQRAFRLLIKVQGISGNLALAILSTFSAERLATYLADEQSDFLTEVSGIGGKLAKRTTAELAAAAKKGEFGVPLTAAEQPRGGSRRDAMSALVRLGYGRGEVGRALAAAEGETVEELIVNTLKELANGAQ